MSRGYRYFVLYPGASKLKLVDILKLNAVTLPPFFALIGNGHVPHAATKYLPYGNLRYHVYLFPSDRTLQDSFMYGYNWRLGVAVMTLGKV